MGSMAAAQLPAPAGMPSPCRCRLRACVTGGWGERRGGWGATSQGQPAPPHQAVPREGAECMARGPPPPCAGAGRLPLLFPPQLQQGQEQGRATGERGVCAAALPVHRAPRPRALPRPGPTALALGSAWCVGSQSGWAEGGWGLTVCRCWSRRAGGTDTPLTHSAPCSRST